MWDLTLVSLWCGRTVGRTVTWPPNFLSYGAPLARASRARWTISKVMGGGGRNKKNYSSKGKCPKKNSCKVKPKEKKFMQRTGLLFHQNDSLCVENFYCAVSGFCQVFILTRAKSVFFFLAVSPLVALDSGRHRRFPHAWINLWYPGYQNNNISWWEGEPLSLNKRREDKFRDWSMTLKKSKYIEICDFIAYKHSWGLSSDILEEDRLTSVVFEVVH